MSVRGGNESAGGPHDDTARFQSTPEREQQSMIRDDDLKETLDRASSEIAEIQSNPRAWLTWVIYLLDRLEAEATKGGPADKDSYMEMLSALQDTIRNKDRTGGW